jgi:5'-3' exoribonuclease 1
MGVPSFYKWLQKNNKGNINLIKKNLDNKINYLMIDTNCLLHPNLKYIVDMYKNKLIHASSREEMEEIIFSRMEEYLNDIIEKTNPEYVYIAIDGVAPIGKISQQRQRRFKTQNDLLLESTLYPIQTLELTPGTKYMERLHLKLKNYAEKYKYIYSSYLEEGEGEHKILQYIKHLPENINIIIYGLDADLLFLALTNKMKHNIIIMREEQILNEEEEKNDIIKDIKYNYVMINQLHKTINNYNITSEEFIILCYLIGNDFLPKLLSIDVFRNGILNLINAYTYVKSTFKMNLVEDNKINYKTFLKIFERLEIYEKNVFENNTLFDNEMEYYRYYTKTEINDDFKIRMVENYMKTIEWCYLYYTQECPSWTWNYGFYAPPLIKDIVKYYSKININIDKNKNILKPVEQLTLVIPKQYHPIVMDNRMIKDINYFKIGYLYPKEFKTDLCLEKKDWKQNILIPIFTPLN